MQNASWFLILWFFKNLVNSPGFQISPSFYQKKIGEFTKFSPGFQIGEFTRFSPGFHISFTKFSPKKLGEFTRFSPGFHISPSFHRKKTWWIHQVFTRFLHFTKFSPKKTWWIHQVFTRFSGLSPGFGNSPGFRNAPDFHQVLEIHQVFTRFSPSFHQVLEFHKIQPKFHRKTHKFHQKTEKTFLFVKFGGVKHFFGENLVKTWWFHQVFTKFSPDFGDQVLEIHQDFSPSFHQVLEIHQVFTKFSPGFQVFLPSMGDQSGGVRIASSFHCSDGRYVILKQAFFWHHFQEKNARNVLYSLLNTQNASLEWNVGGSLANPP